MSTAPHTLVGRTVELQQLESALDDLAAGGSSCLAVEGEPGIGKTRLLAELRRRAEARGHLVLSGSAAEFERDLPFGVWVDALDAFTASRMTSLREHLDEVVFDELAGALPSVSSERRIVRPGVDARHPAHRAFRRLLEAIGEATPLVLLLDDLHWTDDASIDLIAAVVRRGTAVPVLLALGYRSGQAPVKLGSALTSPAVRIVELPLLDERESSALLGESVSARRRALIFRESGGNPFYALQLARSEDRSAESSSADRMASAAGVPRVVAAALIEEMQGLSANAGALLNAGAVAGDPFDPELACEIAQLTPNVAMDALDELLDAGLLRATDLPRLFAFRHPLVRRAIYGAIKGGWRLGAHARAAAALGGRGAAPTARAHHVEQAAAPGDREAVSLLLEAGDLSAPTAPVGAARWYTSALRLLPETDQPARLGVLVRLADVLRRTGELDQCRRRLVEALALVPAKDTKLRLRLTSACAACENFLGHHDQAQKRLVAALETMPEQESGDAVMATLSLVSGAFFERDFERMTDLARRALASALRVGEPGLIGHAAAGLSHAAVIAGEIAEAQLCADEASLRLEGLGDAELASRLDAVNRLSWAEFSIERYADATRHAERGVQVAAATGQAQFLPLTRTAQALSTMMLGNLRLAGAIQEEALETARLAANDYVTCSVLTGSGHVMAMSGDLEAARRLGEESVDLVQDLERGQISTMAEARLAMTLRELGGSAAETEALVDSAGGWDLALLPGTWRVMYLEALTRIELAAGDGEAAARSAAACRQAAASLGLSLCTALALRAQARVLQSDGDPAAVDLALSSVDLAQAVGARIEAARSRAVAGTSLAVAGAGRRARAVALLREAEAELDACGALRARSEVRRELRKRGARIEPRGRAAAGTSGLESLSPREREVAELVTARKTNREMASELFLSEKTIESHLRNIFAKLSASSRVDVARAVEREATPSRAAGT